MPAATAAYPSEEMPTDEEGRRHPNAVYTC